MCGIFGMIGNVPKERQLEAHTLLKNLFRVSLTRGKDASGFSAIHNETRAALITEKRPISSVKFIKRCTKFKALKKSMPSIFIGHTRLSTAGNPSRGRNNHPFSNSRYSMVHNGTIKDWRKAVKNNGIKMRSETDSEIILHILERYSDAHQGFQTVVDTLHRDSAMAVALLRHGGNGDFRLSLFRNDDRPLVVVTIPYFKSIFFASTKQIVDMALKFTYKDKAAETIKRLGLNLSEVPSFQYLEFALNAFGNPYTLRRVPVKKPIAGFLPAPKTVPPKLPISSNPGYNLPVPNREGTKIAVDQLTMAAAESGKILQLIKEHPHITKEEIVHWKKWKNRV